MKNNILLTLVFLLTSSLLTAQVAVNNDGSTPDPSAALDIKSSTKGLLVPRMSSAQRTGIPMPATGLLVFDLDSNKFFYYTGSGWSGIGAGASAAATASYITDTDTDTKVEVEKTSDNDNIVFSMGGIDYFRMDSARLEVLNSGGSVFIGEGTGKNTTTGLDNTAVGNDALLRNTTGYQNTALGYSALSNNITGGGNVALGDRSLITNTTGGHNTAVGGFALNSNYSGMYNIAVGSSAGSSLTTGNQNIIIGYSAQVPYDTAYYQMSIGNLIYGVNVNGQDTFLSTGNIGIGTKFPNERLEVNGSIRMTDGNQADNTVMVGDSNGTAKWAPISSLGLGGGSGQDSIPV